MLENYGKDYPRVALEQVMMLFRKFHNHYQMKYLEKIQIPQMFDTT